MTTVALTELNAVILLALAKATAEEPERYLTRKESRMDHEFAERSLNQLERAGLVEQKMKGARARGWRLTALGVEHVPMAQRLVDQAQQQRREAWEAENLVYGTDRTDKEPLTPRQQRAWMRGFVQAQLATASLPADAPAEIRDNFPALVAWMTKFVAPHRPD